VGGVAGRVDSARQVDVVPRVQLLGVSLVM
jgi:hypothetical protein